MRVNSPIGLQKPRQPLACSYSLLGVRKGLDILDTSLVIPSSLCAAEKRKKIPWLLLVGIESCNTRLGAWVWAFVRFSLGMCRKRLYTFSFSLTSKHTYYYTISRYSHYRNTRVIYTHAPLHRRTFAVFPPSCFCISFRLSHSVFLSFFFLRQSSLGQSWDMGLGRIHWRADRETRQKIICLMAGQDRAVGCICASLYTSKLFRRDQWKTDWLEGILCMFTAGL